MYWILLMEQCLPYTIFGVGVLLLLTCNFKFVFCLDPSWNTILAVKFHGRLMISKARLALLNVYFCHIFCLLLALSHRIYAIDGCNIFVFWAANRCATHEFSFWLFVDIFIIFNSFHCIKPLWKIRFKSPFISKIVIDVWSR